MKPSLKYTPPTRSMAHPGQAKSDHESSQALVKAVVKVVAVLQLKARSSPVHSAVDWLYLNMAAVAALEQALLQPSHTLTWTSNLHNQASGYTTHRTPCLTMCHLHVCSLAWNHTHMCQGIRTAGFEWGRGGGWGVCICKVTVTCACRLRPYSSGAPQCGPTLMEVSLLKLTPSAMVLPWSLSPSPGCA